MKILEVINLLEGKVKNAAIDAEYDRQFTKAPVKFGIMINGKVWKKLGQSVSFKDYTSAHKIADKITATKNITTQVIVL